MHFTPSKCSVAYLMILSRVTVTKDGVRLIIGFIADLQVVTTNNYNIVTDYHTTSTPRYSLQSISTSLHAFIIQEL
jgi:hypothetical protein